MVWQAASLVLGYPDSELLDRRSLIDGALGQDASEHRSSFDGLFEVWASQDLATVQQHYVEVFDLSRKQTLYLSYYTDGDTRRRGETLAAIKQRYRRSSFLVNTHGELTDYLPLILEYAARVDPVDGRELLQEFRRSLELLRLALIERSTPYAGVISAVCATLPGASPQDRQAVMAMAGSGPPTETVGLEPGDPRLLPMGM
ncbi:MAG: nitrate reductase molybdenum cofactor assembly chaperone [Microlunatus sp.]|nr:nitrate reductase molybdenum cofactor assembly chaperone [Microlunatus sp.]MDN5804506.1 nitrate reductase molybdenum cofactor assembly chaperone [Microlunatus sp.]